MSAASRFTPEYRLKRIVEILAWRVGVTGPSAAAQRASIQITDAELREIYVLASLHTSEIRHGSNGVEVWKGPGTCGVRGRVYCQLRAHYRVWWPGGRWKPDSVQRQHHSGLRCDEHARLFAAAHALPMPSR